jgi:Ca-activated chloride channel family protein
VSDDRQYRGRIPGVGSGATKVAAETPVSTFPIEVDTASYEEVRQALQQRTVPEPDAIHVAEMINAFDYSYAAPLEAARPFRSTIAIYPSPWNARTKILHIGIKGLEFPERAQARVIARDVRVQVEFNPAHVAEYRLIGYATVGDPNPGRKSESGEIASGHAVTALYEITPVASSGPLSDPQRYGARTVAGETNGEVAFLKIRYRLPNEDVSRHITRAVTVRDVHADFADVPRDMRFAASVAAAGQLLCRDPGIGSFDYEQAIALADAARGEDSSGARSEFTQLLRQAQSAVAQKPLDQSELGAVK